MNYFDNFDGGIMAAGAHPDDLEIITGQAINNLARTGRPVYGFVGTLGTASSLHFGADRSFCRKRL